jgi:lysophospholipase L1-like esterase
MIYAIPSLAAEGFDANARGCRQFPEALALMRSLRDAHALPHLVVLALGANGSVTDAYVRQALSILGHTRQLALVTPREAGGGSGSDAVTVRAEARRHPDQVHTLDWVSYSAGHDSWFQPDRLHLTLAGARAFARLVGRALAFAVPPGHRPVV